MSSLNWWNIQYTNQAIQVLAHHVSKYECEKTGSKYFIVDGVDPNPKKEGVGNGTTPSAASAVGQDGGGSSVNSG